jgi:mannose-1-phosphate guanylyltransferase
LIRVDRALVLTAGLATRLRPLSLARAKAALPLAGVPLAVRILRRLAEQGVREAVLNLHHRPETIAREIGDGTGTGLRVRYSWEQPLLGSAGGPRKALPLVDADRFFIINGDTLTDVPLDAVLDAHARSGALVTMAVIPNPRPDHYGGVVVEEGFVQRFTNRGSPEPNYLFIGVQVAEARAFAALPDDRPSESVGALYPTLIQDRAGAIAAFISQASFDDIGGRRAHRPARGGRLPDRSHGPRQPFGALGPGDSRSRRVTVGMRGRRRRGPAGGVTIRADVDRPGGPPADRGAAVSHGLRG